MSLITSLVLLTLAVLPLPVMAWNIPGHMLSAAIVYQILLQENPPTIEKVKTLMVLAGYRLADLLRRVVGK